MTNSEVQQLRRGSVVYEDGTCRAYTCTGDPKPAKAQTHYEAWAVSASGRLVARVSQSSGFHTAEQHREHAS